MIGNITKRAHLGIAVWVIVGVLGIIGPLTPSSAHAQGSSEDTLTTVDLIHDDADILDDERVADAVNKLSRLDDDQDTKVAFYTTDDVSKSDYDSDITQLIKKDDDPQIMQDGLIRKNVIVVTISPTVRQIGVYARSGSALENPTAVEKAVNEMKPYAQEADWDNTAFVGAAQYLEETDVATREDPEAITQREENSKKIGNALLSVVAIVAGLAFLIGLIVLITSSIRSARQRSRVVNAVKAAPVHQYEQALDDWTELSRIRAKGFHHIDGPSPHRMKDILCQARSAHPDTDVLVDLEDVSTDILLNPRDDEQHNDLLELAEHSTISGKRAWKRNIDEMEENHIAGIRNIDEEIEALDVPESLAKRLRSRADKTVDAIDKEIRNVEDKGVKADVIEALVTIDELITDFEKYAKNTIRSMSADEYAQMAPLPSHSGSSKKQNDHWKNHGYLFPAYLLGVYTASSYNSGGSGYSGSSSGTGGGYSTPTSFSSGFSGGGFSGGSSGF